jgi:hypothetical protein
MATDTNRNPPALTARAVHYLIRKELKRIQHVRAFSGLNSWNLRVKLDSDRDAAVPAVFDVEPRIDPHALKHLSNHPRGPFALVWRRTAGGASGRRAFH